MMRSLGLDIAAADLLTQLSTAIQGGVGADRAIEVAGDAIGDLLAHTSRWSEGLVRFEPGGGRGQVSIPVPIPRLVAGGLRRVRPAETVRRELGRFRHAPLTLHVPNDAPEAQWGLPPVAFRLVRDAVRVTSLGELLGAARGGETDEGWLALDLAVQLGLIRLHVDQQRKNPEIELSPEDRNLQAELKGVALHFSRLPAIEILQITTSKQATDQGVERAFRDVSSRFHPDRFMQHALLVQQAAAECFALVGDARSSLMDDPELRAEVEARLRAAEEGKIFISNRDRMNIEKAVSAAELATRKRDWEEAWKQASQVLALDPADLRALYVQAQAGCRVGKLSPVESVERIRALRYPNRREKADALFQAGEILVTANQEIEALPLFHQAVEADPEHVGARRRIRLHDKRTALPPEPAPASGFSLKGLFSWGKSGGSTPPDAKPAGPAVPEKAAPSGKPLGKT